MSFDWSYFAMKHSKPILLAGNGPVQFASNFMSTQIAPDT